MLYTFFWSISTTLRKRYVFTTCLLIINIKGICRTQSCWHRLFLNLEKEQKRFLANSNYNIYLTCFTKCQQGFFCPFVNDRTNCQYICKSSRPYYQNYCLSKVLRKKKYDVFHYIETWDKKYVTALIHIKTKLSL